MQQWFIHLKTTERSPGRTKGRENYQHTEENMDSYLKCGFIQCPNTDKLPRPQCVTSPTVLGSEAMKPSWLNRNLTQDIPIQSTKTHWILYALKKGCTWNRKEHFSPSFNHWHLTSDACYIISLQIAKCRSRIPLANNSLSLRSLLLVMLNTKGLNLAAVIWPCVETG